MIIVKDCPELYITDFLPVSHYNNCQNKPAVTSKNIATFFDSHWPKTSFFRLLLLGNFVTYNVELPPKL